MLGVPIGSPVGSLLRKGFQQERERVTCYLMIHRVGGRTGTTVKALRSGRGGEGRGDGIDGPRCSEVQAA